MQENKIIDEIDEIIRASLMGFVEDVFRSSWKGREREAVSLYVLGHLQKQCGKDKILREPTQIGIEAAVPSSLQLNPKGRFAKTWYYGASPR